MYEKNCSVCEKSIVKDCVESNGKFYHSKCMKCVECRIVLDGAYYILMGRFLCEKDYNVGINFTSTCHLISWFQKKKKRCYDCGKMIDGLYYTDNNNKTVCEADYKVK